jgi:2,3-bisphosphoglycerate-independent phosphoglycerate mutase
VGITKEVVHALERSQLHIAETEKYAHITLFLNGTIEESFKGEDRILIPSPQVSSYATVPKMSVVGITKEVVHALERNTYDFIAINFANADMVGHSGNLKATIKACEFIDKAMSEVVESTLSRGGVVVITADHGNAEEVINLQTGTFDKEHSTNPVPFLIIGRDFLGQAGPGGDPIEGDLSLLSPVGVLGDVAPTLLKLLEIKQPVEMLGKSLM